jgi:hypothetical protein
MCELFFGRSAPGRPSWPHIKRALEGLSALQAHKHASHGDGAPKNLAELRFVGKQRHGCRPDLGARVN